MPNSDEAGSSVAADAAVTAAAAAAAAASKPKRVRTGCLTCRERHLKCDEGLPICQNCRKSSRTCKRGVRLNFIDTQVKSPPILPPTADWAVHFRDESREIASEYKGGIDRYAALDQAITPPHEQVIDYSVRTIPIDPQMIAPNSLPPIIQPGAPGLYPESGGMVKEDSHGSRSNSIHLSGARSDTGSYLGPSTNPTSYGQEQTLTPPNDTREYLNTPEEVLFMQVFVEEVGLWMDSMDSMKHFSRLLPFHALGEPMLLNAFLACGARHLTLVNPAYHEDKALYYYDTATTQLLRALQNPDRDTVICATTAVILNVYEIMSERAMQRMNHIAGARALIKECGWSAKSTGIGGACFWLNVGMELLSCLHFNWQVAWEPDQWNLDMDWGHTREEQPGREELWVHRMIYICAKVANFRASIPRFQEPSAHDEQVRLRNRYAEWERLKSLCDAWNSCIPRTMHPMAYLYPSQTASKSTFPEVWLIKRATIMGRLFYHTALTLLAQINPLQPVSSPEMSTMQLSHAHQICGIVAHVKDRGVASAALRCMAIAAEVLVDRREQEEVLQVFDKIRKETGWQIGFLYNELKEKWGWNRTDLEVPVLQQAPPPPSLLPHQQIHSSANMFASSSMPLSGLTATALPPAAPAATSAPQLPTQQSQAPAQQPSVPKGGILNPLLRTADFSLPNHPYQQYYQPPNQVNSLNHIWF